MNSITIYKQMSALQLMRGTKTSVYQSRSAVDHCTLITQEEQNSVHHILYLCRKEASTYS